VKASVTQSAVVLFMFTVLFGNIFAGLAGAVLTLALSLYWWRSDRPGRRRVEGRDEA